MACSILRALARTLEQPVLAAQLVQHGAADAGGGVGLELRVGGFLITTDSIEQADHAGLYEVVELDAGRQAGEQLQGQLPH